MPDVPPKTIAFLPSTFIAVFSVIENGLRPALLRKKVQLGDQALCVYAGLIPNSLKNLVTVDLFMISFCQIEFLVSNCRHFRRRAT